jgi:hypothetical protein
MKMNFIFVDETGDPGRKGTQCFGYGLLHIQDDKYFLTRRLLCEIRQRSGIWGDLSGITKKAGNQILINILQGLASLSKNNQIVCSGLYINKSTYGGRYLEWSELPIGENVMAYRLKNYLLRHLLEFHFSYNDVPQIETDIILDRWELSEGQRQEMFNYLNGKTAITLAQPFSLPKISYLTIADNEYICGLELAHILADMVKRKAMNKLSDEYSKLIGFIRIREFIGHQKEEFGL